MKVGQGVGDTERHAEETHMKTEAETGATWAQATEHWEPPVGNGAC